LEKGSPKSGDYVALTWKKEDMSIWGGTEGFVVGTVEDGNSKQYLILDRSTYNNSLKSVLFSLGLFDFWLAPTSDIESVLSLSQRERPPGISEKMHFKMEIHYKSNIDYEETKANLQKRGGCLVEVNQPVQTEGSCNFTVRNIDSIGEASIVFSPTGNLQIDCLPKQLNQCLEWVEKSVEIPADHKNLVLIPTNLMFSIHDNFKEPTEPTEDLIDGLGRTEGNKSIILPLGWIHYFSTDLDDNPLKELFPDLSSVDMNGLIKDKSKRPLKEKEYSPVKIETEKHVDLSFIKNQVAIDKYLSTEAPIEQMERLIFKPEEENGLKNWWMRSRFDRWNWLNMGPGGFQGKALVRSLIIDRKNGFYTTDFRKYYGTDFFLNKSKNEGK
jgi:hypothetical protein